MEKLPKDCIKVEKFTTTNTQLKKKWNFIIS